MNIELCENGNIMLCENGNISLCVPAPCACPEGLAEEYALPAGTFIQVTDFEGSGQTHKAVLNGNMVLSGIAGICLWSEPAEPIPTTSIYIDNVLMGTATSQWDIRLGDCVWAVRLESFSLVEVLKYTADSPVGTYEGYIDGTSVITTNAVVTEAT